MDFGKKFDSGLDYQAFLDQYADENQRGRWNDFHAAVALTDDQKSLLSSFVRETKVLVLAGTWCGDCVNQCPIFDHIANASHCIKVHYFDRDENPDLAEALQTCGAARVPAVLFLSEDNHVCGRYGDRTLTKYRAMAEQFTGAACPSGIVIPGDPLLSGVIQDWLDEFERIQWMLRTSGRLRQLHGD
ncbi:MAG: thioredoxin family protein [Planctomycetota bacterium]|nr:thioredoxin family protein [Planctomycetota bacterium]